MSADVKFEDAGRMAQALLEQGVVLGSGIRRFAGIPYAEAPTDGLRFQPPRPLVMKRTDWVDPCPVALQNPPRLQGVSGVIEHPQSEDCLRLTIWTPANASQERPLPVLFWLHGGAFLTGGGALNWYDGARLCAEGGVVIVSPNYRLGALGFLCSPGLAQGNMGLQDAELALGWVRRNIAAFGGDPERITVMGHSAGGWLAALLAMRMPAQQPWMQQLILLSAPLGAHPAPLEQAHDIGAHFLAELPHELSLDALARIPASRLLAAQANTVQTMGRRHTPPGHPPMPLGPVADGSFLPSPQAYASALREAASRVPVVVGWTHDEMRAFAGLQQGPRIEEVEQASAEALFVQPSLAWADAARQGGRDVFAFRFDWAATDNPLGACHGITSPFVFGNLHAYGSAPMLRGAQAAPMQALSRRLRLSLLAFVRDGHPAAAGHEGLRDWAAYRTRNMGVRIVNAEDAQ